MSEEITVYGIWHDSMGGAKFLETVYRDKRKAELVAKDKDDRANCPKNGKWEAFGVRELKARTVVSSVESNGKVYHYDASDATEDLRKRALSKLTEEDRKLLGLE
jgi:hypothetical protein